MAEKTKQFVDQMPNDGWNPEDETIYTNYLGYGVFDEPTTMRVKESQIAYVRKDALVDAIWSWVENNILSSSQQDKSLLYYKEFKKYMEGTTT